MRKESVDQYTVLRTAWARPYVGAEITGGDSAFIQPDRLHIRNIGLLAHVDAGKTTTTEQMLFHAGQIRQAGRVADGTTRTDYLDVERAIRVIDGAVLIISAVEGVHAHTETLWHALRARGIPTILFINKLDRYGASPERVLAQIRSALTDRSSGRRQLR